MDSEGWLHTGDLATIENELCQSRWISHAIMIGDRHPYPVALITLDEDEILLYAKENDLRLDLPTLATHPDVVALIHTAIDAVNAHHSTPEKIKRFAILPRDLTIDSGELTPSLKVKRPVVLANHAGTIDRLYEAHQ